MFGFVDSQKLPRQLVEGLRWGGRLLQGAGMACALMVSFLAGTAHAESWYVYQVYASYRDCDDAGINGSFDNMWTKWHCDWDSPGFALWVNDQHR